jgi:DNA-binding SARP family transcriptional activator
MTVMSGTGVVDHRDLPGTLGRGLLAALVLRRSPVRRSELAEMLQRNVVPERWDATLNSTVSRLRSQLSRLGLDGRDWLLANNGTVEFRRVSPVFVDVEAAQAAIDRATCAWRAGDSARAWADATTAYSVTARPFLPSVEGYWVEEVQRDLDEVRRRALRIVVEAALGAGDHHHAEVAARRLVRDDPLREDSHRLLIRTYLASGDRARAKRALVHLATLLADELSVDPSPETLALLA